MACPSLSDRGPIILVFNILHSTTDPDLLTRLREMLDSSPRADIAVGYFFMSGFEAVADSLSQLEKVRILVGRVDRPVLESVALGLQQSEDGCGNFVLGKHKSTSTCSTPRLQFPRLLPVHLLDGPAADLQALGQLPLAHSS